MQFSQWSSHFSILWGYFLKLYCSSRSRFRDKKLCQKIEEEQFSANTWQVTNKWEEAESIDFFPRLISLQKEISCIQPLPLLSALEDSCTSIKHGSPLCKTLHVLKHVTDKKNHISEETKCKVGNWTEEAWQTCQGAGILMKSRFQLPFHGISSSISCLPPTFEILFSSWWFGQVTIENDWPLAGAGSQTQAALLTNLILSLKNARPSQADGCGHASLTVAWS